MAEAVVGFLDFVYTNKRVEIYMKTLELLTTTLRYMKALPRRITKFLTTTMLTNILGLIVTKLRSLSVVEKMARLLRFRFPRLWRTLMRIIKPVYLTYQWRKNSRIAHEFSKSVDTFDNEKWLKQQMLRSRNYDSYPTCSGIANSHPSVEPQILLEKINKNLAALTH